MRMPCWTILLVGTLSFGTFQLGAAPYPAVITAQVDGAGHVKLRLPHSDPSAPDLKVLTEEDQEKLSMARSGDQVKCVVDETGTKVEAVQQITRSTSVSARLGSLLLGLALVIVPAALVTRKQPQKFLIGADKRYSNSQVQLALWFTTVASVYVATIVLRLTWNQGFFGGVGLPANVLALSGLSALSFGGAKVITTQKAITAAKTPDEAQKTTATESSLLKDLVQNDAGDADFGDFQMILVTCAAVVIFGMTAFHLLGALPVAADMSLPDVDSTLLSAFGLGQGAYLVKKAAVKVGQG